MADGGNVIKADIRPRFYCPAHGPTNHVQGLGAGMYCVACLHDIAHQYLPTVGRMSERPANG